MAAAPAVTSRRLVSTDLNLTTVETYHLQNDTALEHQTWLSHNPK